MVFIFKYYAGVKTAGTYVAPYYNKAYSKILGGFCRVVDKMFHKTGSKRIVAFGFCKQMQKKMEVM